MQKGLAIVLVIFLLPAVGFCRLHQEPIFGIDVPVYHWGWQADRDIMSRSCTGRLGAASDAANLRFANGNDTTDIILIADKANWQIHWLRCQAGPGRRPLQHFGSFGTEGSGVGEFYGLECLAVASTGPLYDPTSDHIFAADRMSHRIIKLNFSFDPGSPESDRFIWESACYVDSEFYPIDLEYVNLNTGNRRDNRLLALDDIGERLLMFSEEGNLLNSYSLADPPDSVCHIYCAFDYKINENSLSLYLVDRGNNNIRHFRLSRRGLEFVNEMNLGATDSVALSGILYAPAMGLWAIDFLGPHIYKITDDLSRVIRERGPDDLDPALTLRPVKEVLFPERIVVFEEPNETAGIVTFAFNEPLPKESPPSQEVIPFRFALEQNYPNPFNPNTAISFELPTSGWVKLEIFNILGQKVKTLANEHRNAGPQTIVWDGSNDQGDGVASGVYFTKLTAGDKIATKKMTLLK